MAQRLKGTRVEYLDFELRIAPGAGREYPVSVLQSPAGETHATMQFPFDTLALENQLQGIEIAVLRSSGTRRDVVAQGGQEHVGVSDFGRKLFEALMTDTVRETFRRSRDRARASGKGLRLRLRIEAPELAALPWEYLYDPAEGDYICLSTDTPVVRYLEFDRPPEAIRVQPPLSILGMIASPSDRATLDVSREKQRIEVATAGLRKAGLLKLTWLEGSTWRDLQRALRQGTYHIFHFVGHGGFDSTSGEGVVAMTDEEGTSALMSATQLGRLLADHQSLRMVVLNSCLGAKGSATDVFSSTASILVRRGVSAVVAMQYEISDRAAVEFARSLYEALADSMPVDAAVAEARKAVSLSLNNTVEWGTPVLFMRSPDGALFRIDGMTTSVARASGTYQSMETPPVVARERVDAPTAGRDAGDSAVRVAAEPGRAAPAAVRSVEPPAVVRTVAPPASAAPPASGAPPAAASAVPMGGFNQRRLLIGGVAAVLLLVVAYFTDCFGLHRPSNGDDNEALPTQTDSIRDSTSAPEGGAGGADSTAHDSTSSPDSTSNESAATPPADPAAVSDWDRMHASVGDVRVEAAGGGVWNVMLVVYYTGSRLEGQAVVDCTLRPKEAVHRTVHFTVPLLKGRKGGTYVAQLRNVTNWPEGTYPVACETDGTNVYDGEVTSPAEPEP
jgi:hypothetical protein